MNLNKIMHLHLCLHLRMGAQWAMAATVVLLLLAAGCESDDADADASSDGPAKVVVAPAVEETIAAPLRVNGSIASMTKATIAAETAARVTRMDRRIGEFVKEGGDLAVLDGSKNAIGIRQAQAAYRQAQAAAEKAEGDFKRAETLYKTDKISEQEYDTVRLGAEQARAAADMQRAALAALQRNAKDYVIRAPFDGYVTGVNLQEGDLAAPGVPAFTMIAAQGIKAVFKIPAEQIAAMKVGEVFQVQIPAAGTTLPATVSAVGMEADAMSRTFPVEMDIDVAETGARVGMVARLSAELPTANEGVFVPAKALVEKFGGTYLFVAKDNTARELPVTIRERTGDKVAVSGDLAAGDAVIIEGQHRLKNGAAIQVRDVRDIAEQTG